MLPRKYRLTKKIDFQRVLEKGQVFQGRFFGLRALSDEKRLGVKAGVIVSKKISKKAVLRNKIKRLWRLVMSENISKIRQDTLLVFLAKKPVVDADRETVAREIKSLLSKAKVL